MAEGDVAGSIQAAHLQRRGRDFLERHCCYEYESSRIVN